MSANTCRWRARTRDTKFSERGLFVLQDDNDNDPVTQTANDINENVGNVIDESMCEAEETFKRPAFP